MKRIAFWTILTLFGCVSWSPAWAARVEGIGSLQTNLPDPFESIDTEYEHPVLLNVADSVQLPSSLIGSNSKLLEYRGQAKYGRLGVRSFIGGQAPSAPNLSTGVDVSMGSLDQITPQNLNPLTANLLRLDVELSGDMSGLGADANAIGKLTAAFFGITMLSLDQTSFRGVSSVQFTWFGDFFFITDGTGPSAPFGFVPYPGEEPRFTQQDSANFFFDARGFVDIPLHGVEADFGGEPFLFGDPFLLDIHVGATSSCGNEVPSCLAITDFGNTALIGNARIVDQNGNLIPGALFTSESGYDYITPPGPFDQPSAVPEPSTYAMMLAGLGLLGWVARLRKRGHLRKRGQSPFSSD